MIAGISVVICCHNSSQRLPQTLQHLAAQRVPQNLRWELLVIDNASIDKTAETARQCWPKSSSAQLRVIPELNPGLNYARIRGIQEARHEIISFIDDDNWLHADWIARVSEIFLGCPEIGAVGWKK